MKDTPRESFRWAAHTGGLAIVRPKDYDFSGEVEASTPYAAWQLLATDGRALCPGDLLESVGADGALYLQIAKYIGFEPAQWFVPEPKSDDSLSSTGLSATVESNPHTQPI